VVPDVLFSLNGLDDKDKDNTAVRLMVYKPQVDDLVKVLRKFGYSSRLFSYNHQKWLDDKKHRQVLKETLA